MPMNVGLESMNFFVDILIEVDYDKYIKAAESRSFFVF